jgi:hypothetical protein
MKIDLVYTWVDPTNKEWMKERNFYKGKNTDEATTGMCRYASYDEIKYSMRSVFQNCNFIRNIYLVTNKGSRPKWLKEYPNVIIVDDKTIFPSEDMTPCYNSNAIESCLHNIPGLSEIFIYMNDDFLILTKLELPDLLTEDKKKFIAFMETEPVFQMFSTSMFLSSIQDNIIRIPDKTTSARNYTFQTVGVEPFTNPLAHCVRIYSKALIKEFERKFFLQVNNTRYHRFREESSFCFCEGYARHYEKMGLVKYRGDWYTKVIGLTDYPILNSAQIDLAKIYANTYRFLCIEDGRTKFDEKEQQNMVDLLESLFPIKAPWEKEFEEERSKNKIL